MPARSAVSPRHRAGRDRNCARFPSAGPRPAATRVRATTPCPRRPADGRVVLEATQVGQHVPQIGVVARHGGRRLRRRGGGRVIARTRLDRRRRHRQGIHGRPLVRRIPMGRRCRDETARCSTGRFAHRRRRRSCRGRPWGCRHGTLRHCRLPIDQQRRRRGVRLRAGRTLTHQQQTEQHPMQDQRYAQADHEAGTDAQSRRRGIKRSDGRVIGSGHLQSLWRRRTCLQRLRKPVQSARLDAPRPDIPHRPGNWPR